MRGKIGGILRNGGMDAKVFMSWKECERKREVDCGEEPFPDWRNSAMNDKMVFPEERPRLQARLTRAGLGLRFDDERKMRVSECTKQFGCPYDPTCQRSLDHVSAWLLQKVAEARQRGDHLGQGREGLLGGSATGTRDVRESGN